MVAEFDDEKFCLGRLCKRKHEWNCTGKSLRYKSSNACRECIHGVAKGIYKPQKIEIITINDKFYLGSLCLRRHDYQETGKSLRYNSTGVCIECQKENDENRPRNGTIEAQRKACATYRIKHRTQRNYYSKQWRLSNKEKVSTYNSEYAKLNRELMCAKEHRRRVRKNTNHHVFYSVQELKNLYQQFNNSCAYCGSLDKLTIDHFIPLLAGGSDVLGNLIPCCKSCNSRKGTSDPLKWYQQQPFYSVNRWKRILKILGKTEQTYNQIPLF